MSYHIEKPESQEYLDILAIVSTMSFNQNKLSKETFVSILSQCKHNANIRRAVYQLTNIYKCKLDLPELLLKLNEANLLCKNNNLINTITRNAFHVFNN